MEKVQLNKENIEDIFPASDISQGLLFHSLANPDLHLYHEQIVLQTAIRQFDKQVFDRAFSLMVEKHPNLRSDFNMSDFDQPVQIVYRKVTPDVAHYDISTLAKTLQETRIREFIAADRQQPFLVGNSSSLCRIRTFLLGEQSLCIVWINHHAIIDGWSTSMLMTELHLTYHRLLEDPAYKPVPLQHHYRDFVVRQLAVKKNEAIRIFWQQELEGFVRYRFPGTYDKNDVLRTYRETLSAQVFSEVKAAAALQGISLKHVCLAAYVYAMYMFSYETDLLLGVMTNNRPVMADGDKIIGCFLNTVPFRLEIPETFTWKEFVQLVDQKALSLKKYEAFPFKGISNMVDKEQSAPMLINSIFGYTDFFAYKELSGSSHPVVAAVPGNFLDLHSYERTDTLLDFNIDVTGECFDIYIRYYATVMPADMMEQFGACFRRFLGEYVHNGNAVARKSSLQDQPQPADIASTVTLSTIPALFDRQVTDDGSRTAVTAGAETLTYAALQEKVTALAGRLQQMGVVKGDVVAVSLPRGIDVIIAILAIFKAGLVFLPIEPLLPKERKQYMMKDSGCRFLLGNADTSLEIAHGTFIDIAASASTAFIFNGEPPVATDIAYLLYTSGSTGEPKGVEVTHGNISNYITWAASQYLKAPLEVFPFFTTIAFDLTLTSILLPLTTGNRIIVYGEQLEMPLDTILKEDNVMVIKLTPAHLRMVAQILRQQPAPVALRRFIVGGEALPVELAREISSLFKHQVEIYNEYGPTEATVGCMIHLYDPQQDTTGTVPIGTAIMNTLVFTADKYGQRLPQGTGGELYVAGEGVTPGYRNRAALTAERFGTDASLPAGRFYKTGDLVRWNAAGLMEFAGRTDKQVKIKGYRIEPGEIEEQLLKHPSITAAKVLVAGAGEEVALHAYLISGKEWTPQEVTTHLQQFLPEYMIPSRYFMLDTFPLTDNGKVDTKALLQIVPATIAGTATMTDMPFTAVEEKISAVWKEVLKLEQIGLYDNFFQLGGDSIKLLKALVVLKSTFNKPVQITDLFQYPNVKALAGYFTESPQETVAETAIDEAADMLMNATQKFSFND